MPPFPKLEKLLKRHDFEIVSQHGHVKYRDPQGRTFITSSTPSDRNAENNAIRTLSHVLGVGHRELLKPPIPRPHRRRLNPEPANVSFLPGADSIPVPVEVPTPVEAPLTRAESNVLRQLKRHEAERQERYIEQRWRLGQVMAEAAMMLIEARGQRQMAIAADLYCAVRAMGFAAVLMVAELKTEETTCNIYVVKAGRWFCDFVTTTITETPKWEFLSGTVEVFGTPSADLKNKSSAKEHHDNAKSKQDDHQAETVSSETVARNGTGSRRQGSSSIRDQSE